MVFRIGTPAYMAPEVVRSDEHTTASDIWSFGAMFFEMLPSSTFKFPPNGLSICPPKELV